jgi:hypothetical protein
MCARPDQSEQRDRALERLLAEALQPAASAEAAGRAACPDAELVAAYADQGLATGPGKGLDDDERERLEGHFAACGRCQKILAVLAAGGEDPLADPEVSRLGERAAVDAAPAPPAAARPAARPSQRLPQRWFWWLAPAVGTAAAAMLWMVLRPASPGGTAPVQTAADYSLPAQQEARSLSAPAAPSPAAEPPPAAAPRRDAPTMDRLSARADSAAKESPAATRDETVAAFAAPPAETAPAAPGARSEITGAAAPAAVGAVTQSATVTEQMSVATAANGGRGAAAPASTTTVPGPQDMNQSVRPNDLPISGRNFAQMLNLYTFTSPDGSTLWRLGAGGAIQRSTDRGQTWQQQAGGVTTDLVAGSAASREIAWVVGRAGVILRTADGEHWQQVSPPNGVTGDWAAVVAYDAMSATVVAADLRRFSTQDGGRTWTQQQ